MAQVKRLLATIQKVYDDNSKLVKALKAKQKALEKAGIDYGSPHYKQDRYLRIVKPVTTGKKREFVYVGADPTRQKAALDALERGKQFDQLNAQISAAETATNRLESALATLVGQITAK